MLSGYALGLEPMRKAYAHPIWSCLIYSFIVMTFHNPSNCIRRQLAMFLLEMEPGQISLTIVRKDDYINTINFIFYSDGADF
jgi:hypothetical protein